MLTTAELVTRVSDLVDEDASANAGSFYEERSGRVVRAVQGFLRELSGMANLRQENFTFAGDDTTEFFSYPGDIREVKGVLINGFDSIECSYEARLSDSSLLILDGLVNSHYRLPHGIGFFPVLVTGDEAIVSVRSYLPTIRETAGAITSATWTNGDKTVASIVGVSLVEGSTVDKGNGIKAPDGLVYRVASITNTGELELTEKYKGSTVSGASGAATLGGHIAVDSIWHDWLIMATACRLLFLDRDFEALNYLEPKLQALRLAAVSNAKTVYSENLKRG